MDIKTFVTAMLSIFFVTGAYAAEDFKRISPWEVIIYSTDTNLATTKSGPVGAEVDFKRLSPWEVIIERDANKEVGIVEFTHDQYYSGFHPVMASHYPRFDFNNDGILTRAECREGMRLLDAS